MALARAGRLARQFGVRIDLDPWTDGVRWYPRGNALDELVTLVRQVLGAIATDNVPDGRDAEAMRECLDQPLDELADGDNSAGSFVRFLRILEDRAVAAAGRGGLAVILPT